MQGDDAERLKLVSKHLKNYISASFKRGSDGFVTGF